MKIAVVVPTCRPERFEWFRRDWQPLFDKHSVDLIAVKDEAPWEGIPDFIPKETDMIRSWGFYQAWQRGAEITVSLDDDVSPVGDIFQEYAKGFLGHQPLSPYLSAGALTTSGKQMRGYPYRNRHRVVAVQYGGWEGVPDLDAVTQLSMNGAHSEFGDIVLPVPSGVPVTTCAMNFAFRTKLTPIMWQLPLYEGRYNRFGDIWSGLFQKKVLDAFGFVMLVNGRAKVLHERASDPFANLERESAGMRHNEELWARLSEPSSSDTTAAFCQVVDGAIRYFRAEDPAYAECLYSCLSRWVGLFAT